MSLLATDRHFNLRVVGEGSHRFGWSSVPTQPPDEDQSTILKYPKKARRSLLGITLYAFQL